MQCTVIVISDASPSVVSANLRRLRVHTSALSCEMVMIDKRWSDGVEFVCMRHQVERYLTPCGVDVNAPFIALSEAVSESRGEIVVCQTLEKEYGDACPLMCLVHSVCTGQWTYLHPDLLAVKKTDLFGVPIGQAASLDDINQMLTLRGKL